MEFSPSGFLWPLETQGRLSMETEEEITKKKQGSRTYPVPEDPPDKAHRKERRESIGI